MTGTATDWQPIETAVCKGQPALVYRPLARRTGDDPIAIKNLMGGNRSCWPETVPPGQKACNPTDGACHVTHWMPLPAPPATGASQ